MHTMIRKAGSRVALPVETTQTEQEQISHEISNRTRGYRREKGLGVF
jgi:hypothetical protein